MSTSKRSSVPPKDQHHHYIPRFVLRRFQAEGTQVQYKNAKERKTANKEAQKKGVDLENILVYDLPSETLEIRPIATTYGVQNLYRDIRDTRDIDALEKKLFVLKSEAARIVNLLHQSNGPRTISLKRTQLESFRKFLFVMHYRSHSKTYFQEDHPENAPIREWLAKFRNDFGLTSGAEVWLYALRYYLETPHAQIIHDANALVDKWGMEKLVAMMQVRMDPNVEWNYNALAYKNQSDNYFLCIWEAAEVMSLY